MRARLAGSLLLLLAGCGSKTGLGVVVEERGLDASADAEPPPPDVGPPDAPPPGCAGADVVVVYGADGDPVPARIDLRTTIRIPEADVYFLMDTTGSMVDEIVAMREAVVALIDGLTCPRGDRVCSRDADCAGDERCSPEGRCAPAPELLGCLPDLHAGIGRYAGGPESYMHLLDVSPPSDATRDAIPRTADGSGGNEALYNSVSCIFGRGRCPSAACAGEGRECVGFRPRALPIVVAITDEGDECSYGRFPECSATPESTGAVLREHGAVFVGIDADARGSGKATGYLVPLAMEAGSYGASGEPLVFAGAGSDVVDAVREGLGSVTASPLRLEVVLEEAEGGDVPALPLVDHVAVDTASSGCFPYGDVEDTDGDGHPDAVRAAGPGTTGCFAVVPRPRPPRLAPGATAFLRARLLAGGATVDERLVCFSVE